MKNRRELSRFLALVLTVVMILVTMTVTISAIDEPLVTDERNDCETSVVEPNCPNTDGNMCNNVVGKCTQHEFVKTIRDSYKVFICSACGKYYKIPIRKDVTVYGSFAADSGAGSYRVGEHVTINAGTRCGNWAFGGWTVVSGDVTLADASKATTTFVMPSTSVAITANWKDTTPPPPPPPNGGGSGAPNGGDNGTPNGGDNGTPNGGDNGTPNGGDNGTPNGGDNGAPNGGDNGAPNGGDNGAPNGGDNGAPNGGGNGTPNGGDNGAPNGGGGTPYAEDTTPLIVPMATIATTSTEAPPASADDAEAEIAEDEFSLAVIDTDDLSPADEPLVPLAFVHVEPQSLSWLWVSLSTLLVIGVTSCAAVFYSRRKP